MSRRNESRLAPERPLTPRIEPLSDAVAPASAAQRTVAVLENEPIARDTFRLRLDDSRMARAIRPGQFLMIRPAIGNDPLLGRPFALYQTAEHRDGAPGAVEVVYLVIGRGTRALARLRAGDEVTTWGPLGNGFGPPPTAGPVVFVAGGIGQTPFLALGQSWLGRVGYGEEGGAGAPKVESATMLYGVRSKEYAAGLDDFATSGIAVDLATDDGSIGHRGFVTDLLRRRIDRGDRPAHVVGCGPPAMLAALAKIVADHGIPCDLSLENHMACGFGVCFSCVAPIHQPDGTTDLRRVCVEGPIFPARDVAWD